MRGLAFFAYPGKPSWIADPKTRLTELADTRHDCLDAVQRLAERLEAPAQPAVCHGAPETYSGAEQLNTTSISAILGELLPERTIVSDESATAGQAIFSQTQKAAKHDWLTLTGGSIGKGLPVAIGVAVACPNNKVIALQGDGGAMYTVQALWTMAREALDVTTIILNNSSYAILNIELQRVGGSDPGEMALAMLGLTNPPIQWTAVAAGFGVPAQRLETPEQFRDALEQALSCKGPQLIEAVI